MQYYFLPVDIWRGHAAGDAVGWSIALQGGRSQVRLEFFIDLILPAALWPWDQLSLYNKRIPGIFSGG